MDFLIVDSNLWMEKKWREEKESRLLMCISIAAESFHFSLYFFYYYFGKILKNRENSLWWRLWFSILFFVQFHQSNKRFDRKKNGRIKTVKKTKWFNKLRPVDDRHDFLICHAANATRFSMLFSFIFLRRVNICVEKITVRSIRTQFDSFLCCVSDMSSMQKW